MLQHAKKQGFGGDGKDQDKEDADPSEYLNALLAHAKSKGFNSEGDQATAMDTDKQ